MRHSRMRLAIGLAVSLLLVVVLSVYAAPDDREEYNIRLRNTNVLWYGWEDPPPNELNHDLCPHIPEGIHIVPDDMGSQRRKRAFVQDNANGEKRVRIYDIVRGTATDNLGGDYNWVYRNNITINYDGDVATVKMKDLFRVRGDNAAHELGFKFTWQYHADDIVLMQDFVNGQLVDVYVDLIWPTDDGVTETTNPDFVPGSWDIHYDYGDWGPCDPI